MELKEVVIVSAVRTPIANFSGGLSSLSAVELGKIVILEAIKRASLKKEEIEELIFGNVLPAGLGQNPARQAMLKAGLPYETAAITVNKVCGSGLAAVMLAAQAIACGDARTAVAGGMESMSQAPYYLEKARWGHRMGHGKLTDGMVRDGLWDVVNDFHMGYTAELVSAKYGVTRKEMDEFACLSNDRSLKSLAEGRFKEEILPVEVLKRKGPPATVDADEGPRQTDIEALSRLKPVFKEGGAVTAGNSSKISDGAAAVTLMSREAAKERGIEPLAKVVAWGSAGLPLEDVLVTPIRSIPKVLKKAGYGPSDIDLHEINEAFAASTVAIMKTLDLDLDRVNVNGGAVALGHPIGASGARVLVTLLTAMKQRGARRGMASLCLGGAEAVSLIVESMKR
jgi:acetyl-CoA C-acetyltransferase